ncbi:hypothetical protein [Shimia sediminis]|uniref:hypothetical protein n=1 Tax=Shimia sediminis TaxID=2497945 RepID=UPI000F8DDE15|nr:hypothetical protein [Shimia sediminis]
MLSWLGIFLVLALSLLVLAGSVASLLVAWDAPRIEFLVETEGEGIAATKLSSFEKELSDIIQAFGLTLTRTREFRHKNARVLEFEGETDKGKPFLAYYSAQKQQIRFQLKEINFPRIPFLNAVFGKTNLPKSLCQKGVTSNELFEQSFDTFTVSSRLFTGQEVDGMICK